MKKLLIVILAAAVLAGGYYLVRLWPLLTIDNTGAEKVVLLHGLGRDERAMWLLESALTDAGYDVFNIAYPSLDEPPQILAEMVGKEINGCCEVPGETVHFVGHSLGGLLLRDHLSRRRPEQLGYVVLIGTPNKGSELAEIELDEGMQELLSNWAGPSARTLHTGPDSYPASLPPPDYAVGIIAGTRGMRTADRWLPTPNDGMVSVASARLEGMADFVTVDATHWGLRSNRTVAAQVVQFLKHGKFDHTANKQVPE